MAPSSIDLVKIISFDDVEIVAIFGGTFSKISELLELLCFTDPIRLDKNKKNTLSLFLLADRFLQSLFLIHNIEH